MTIALIERAKAGDRDAAAQLLKAIREGIFRMVYFRVQSRVDAEDLTQEILLKVHRHLPKLKHAQVFRPWLYRIAVNCVRDFFRKQALLRFLRPFTDEHHPAVNSSTHDRNSFEKSHDALSEVMRKEFWTQFRQLLRPLSKREREVFLLRFLDQLTVKEIALALGKHESTIKTHLYRALKKIKKDPLLEELGKW